MTTTRTDEPANADQEQKSSRFPGFYALPLEARQQAMTVFADLSEDQEQAMTSFNALSESLHQLSSRTQWVRWVCRLVSLPILRSTAKTSSSRWLLRSLVF